MYVFSDKTRRVQEIYNYCFSQCSCIYTIITRSNYHINRNCISYTSIM